MRTRWRLALLGLLLLAIYLLARQSGALEALSLDRLRALCQRAGVFGGALFLLIFAAGELLHVPGIVFVCAAILGYGQLVGGPVAYLGALCSVAVSFIVVRAVGGRALAAVERPFVRRALSRLEARPVRTVALLRLLLFLAPPLNVVLALSPLRLRDYLMGSALGLLLPVALITWLVDEVVRLL